ncbi:hypothetical protein V492_03658 [Pseudogymnoascus sp. VKM F-4246]|nr:hypothetical protein V492_03658 [Pseudogymnoascus sp. VKM F-4246]
MTSTEWSPAKIYIDFSADTVWFDNLRYFPNTPSRSAPKAVPLGDFRRIKRLAMRHPMDRVLLDSTKLFDPEHFPALEEIYIVDTRLQPHPVVLRTYGRYKSKAFDQVWGEETKRPVVHLAEVQEIEEACQKSV